MLEMWQPEFMQRALVDVVAIALGGGPVGVFLMLRRMSRTGDAMAHAILPGAAIGYIFAGLSLPAMTIGGLAAGVIVAVAAGLVVEAVRELPWKPGNYSTWGGWSPMRGALIPGTIILVARRG